MPKSKLLVQCDFDGTVTEEDVSFMLLDAFSDGNWRQLFEEYCQGKMTVGRFNTEAFARVKADRQTMLEAIKDKVKVRAGFPGLAAYCRRKGVRLVIVSNGLDFYIQAILRDINVKGIEVFAAETRFHPEGLRVRYIGPAGKHVDDKFKETCVDHFLNKGYQVVYIGNGISDISPAKKCRHIFAVGDLLAHCNKTNLDFSPFEHFDEVVKWLELWQAEESP